MIRTRTPLAVAVIGALTLAACGGDDEPAAEPAPAAAADDEMAGDDMADDEMADDDMGDDEMADDMAGDDMAGDDMGEDELADDMAGDDMAGDDMADEDMAGGDMAGDDMSMNDVMSVIIGQGDLTVLDAAIHAAGLQDTLHDGGPFTVFAPTDEAFAAYLGEMGMTADDVFADVDALTNLLLAHVVDGTDDAAMVMGMDGQSFTSLAGSELTVMVDGDTVTVGDAAVLEYDLTADNGVIHVIDAVLTPSAS